MTAHATMEERQRCLDAGHGRSHLQADRSRPPLRDGPPLLQASRGAASAAEPKRRGPDRTCRRRGPAAGPHVRRAGSSVVEGVDTEDGLRRVGGNRKLYLKLLREFVDKQGPAGDEIVVALAAGDTAVAERLAHTVRGVAGSLGARGVQESAAALEKGIGARLPPEELKPLLTEFRAGLAGLVEALRSRCRPCPRRRNRPHPSAPLDPGEGEGGRETDARAPLRLRPCGRGVPRGESGRVPVAAAGESFTRFAEEIGGFAFAEARARLEEAAREKGVLPA